MLYEQPLSSHLYIIDLKKEENNTPWILKVCRLGDIRFSTEMHATSIYKHFQCC